MKNMSRLLSKLWAWLRIRVVFSKTLVFIWGLILCYSFIEFGVVGVLMDYLSELFQDTRKAAIMANFEEGLASIFAVVPDILESYVGRFNVIIFCTSSSVIGLILLWVSSDHLESANVNYSDSIFPVNVVYLAVILIAFGEVMDSTLRGFLDYQLKQRVKRRTEATHTESQQNQNGEEEGEQKIDHTFIWWHSAFFIGSLIATFWFAKINNWNRAFKIAVLFMVAAYLTFYSGCLTYCFEKPSGSHRYKMCRVFKAALWNVKLRYPTSEEQYYGENLTEKDFYGKGTHQIRLIPHVPSLWRWLDKAAIKDPSSNIDDLERQEINGELCPVEEVREVKLAASMTHFTLPLLPCSLLMAATNTFFIEQANKLEHASYISGLLVLKFFVCELVVVLFDWVKLKQLTELSTTILRIGIGIFCAVLCCFTAWAVLVYLGKNHSIAILIPQYCLLGLTEGLACKGFERFYCIHVPESMRSLGDAFVRFVFGTGNWLAIIFIYFNTAWFKDSFDNSNVGRYYFLLGILNIVGLLIYGYYFWNYSYNVEGEEAMTEKMEQDSEILSEEGRQEQVDIALEELEQSSEIEFQERQDQFDISAQMQLSIPRDLDVTAETSTMESEEQSLMVSQHNPGTGLILRSSSLVKRDNASNP